MRADAGGAPRTDGGYTYVPPGECRGLQCQQVRCDDGGETVLSGRVFEPGGRLPLYNAIVYVPNDPLEPMPQGVSCDRCGASVTNAVTSALTDEKGRFRLKNVPVGKDIPLVLQIGKWRRQIEVAEVSPCVEAEVPESATRLPRNQTEGDMPQIAIATGGADVLECFLRKVGIDGSEFTPPDQGGRVHLYHSDGFTIPFLNITLPGGSQPRGGSPKSTELWSTYDALRRYDVVVLSCEGEEYMDTKPASALDAMARYLDAGGRVFASHYHYAWFKYGPGRLPDTATWSSMSDSTSNPYTVDDRFPKGAAFADWLLEVDASTTRGEINLSDVRNHAGQVRGESRQWIYKATPNGESAKYFSFNTPLNKPAEEQCGRAVYTDIHIAGEDRSGGTFPDNCRGNELSAQEKALMFLLFDLSACVQDEDVPPEPPVIVL